MASRIAHFNIRARDPEASIGFYRKLGLEPVGFLNLSETMYLIYLGTPEEPDVTLELTVNEAPPAGYDWSAGSGHIALGVGDMDAALARLAEAGFQPEGPPFHPGERAELRVCFVRDPDGVRVELADGEFRTPGDELPERFRN